MHYQYWGPFSHALSILGTVFPCIINIGDRFPMHYQYWGAVFPCIINIGDRFPMHYQSEISKNLKFRKIRNFEKSEKLLNAKIRKIEIPEIRNSGNTKFRKTGISDNPKFREIRNYETTNLRKSEIVKNQIFRKSIISENPRFREIRICETSEIAGNPDFRKIRNFGNPKFWKYDFL